MLEPPSGKASINRLASRFRDTGIDRDEVARGSADRCRDGYASKSAEEAELERKVGVIEKAMTPDHGYEMERAIEQFPYGLGDHSYEPRNLPGSASGSVARIPDRLDLRTDRGSQCTGGGFVAPCKAWNLEHALAPVGRPTGNAVAERVIQALNVAPIWTRDLESTEELREAVAAWMRNYNHI